MEILHYHSVNEMSRDFNMYCYLQLYDHIDNKSLKIWKGKGKKNFLHLGKGIFKKKGETKFSKKDGGKNVGTKIENFLVEFNLI